MKSTVTLELSNEELEEIRTIIEFSGLMAMNALESGSISPKQEEALHKMLEASIFLIKKIDSQAEEVDDAIPENLH